LSFTLANMNNNRSIKEQFLRDEQASSYEQWYCSTRGRWNVWLEDESLLEIMLLSKDDVVLDIGCGTGRQTSKIAKKVKSVIGLDISKNSIQLLNEKAIKNINAYQFDLVENNFFDLPNLDLPFNKVLSVQAIQHIEFQEVDRVLRKIYEFMPAGGKFYCLLYNNKSINRKTYKNGHKKIVEHDNFYEYRYEPEEFSQLLIKNGFVNVKTWGVCSIKRKLVNLLGFLAMPIERLLRRTKFGLSLGYYFICVGEK